MYLDASDNSKADINLFVGDKDELINVSLKDRAKNLDTSKNFKLDENLFIGDKETVISNIDNYCENSNKKNIVIIKNIQSLGAENIFEILDENSDGVVTEEELADMAGTSTLQSAENIDTAFTLSDISGYYKNAMAAKGAIVEEDGNTIKITYSDGQYTELKTDENGNVYSKYYEKNIENDRVGIEYNTQDNSKNRIYLDSQQRPTQIIYDKDGTKFDYTTQYTYNDDGSKVVEVETIGKKVVTEYDSARNTISENPELKYNSDGIIDDTKQKDEGNCWQLSGINALRVTEKGAEIIKNSIQQNEDGSVTVCLKGVNKSYTYTPEDIACGEKEYNSGDVDMDLLTMAISDFRYEKILNKTENVSSKNYELWVSDTATLDDPLYGGLLDEVIYYMTGINSKVKFSFDSQEERIELLHEYLEADKSNIAATISFNVADKTVDKSITTKHTYSIVGADDENIYVENPWNAGRTIACPIDKIKDNIAQISLTYLDESDNIEENKSISENIFTKIGNFFNKISSEITSFLEKLFKGS